MRRAIVLLAMVVIVGTSGCALLPSNSADVPAAVVEVYKQETAVWAAYKADVDAEHEAVVRAYEEHLQRERAELEADQIAAATQADGTVPADELARIRADKAAADEVDARIFARYRAKWTELGENYEMAMRLRAIVSSWIGALDALLEVGHGGT